MDGVFIFNVVMLIYIILIYIMWKNFIYVFLIVYVDSRDGFKILCVIEI